jgi:formylglycine-generating enzyme required for sulfatase activity
MKNIVATVAAVLSFAVSAGSEQASLSGTVTTGGAALVGARVSLKNHPHLVTYTTASGAFVLDGSLPVKNVVNAHGSSILPSIKNDRLVFTASARGQAIRVDIFTADGKRISRSTASTQGAGTISLPLSAGAPGLRLIRLALGGESYFFKWLSGSGGSAATVGTSLRTTTAFGKSAASPVDTIIVSAQGYKHSLIGIDAFSKTDIAVALAASNPWKPSSALTHDKGMVKILAKDYDFEMGRPEQPVTAEDPVYFEQPVQTVNFTKDFWMDTVEVTQSEFDSVMEKTYPAYVVPSTRSSLYGVGSALPEYYVSWGEAALYCNAKSKQGGLDTVYSYDYIEGTPGELCDIYNVTWDLTKNGYRLPTGAEWEYACRGGTATDFFWGKNYGSYPATVADTAEVNQYAIWRVNGIDHGLGAAGYGVHKVGSTKPNAYGLYDMAGNVSEHVNDYESFNYAYGSVTDPAGPDSGIIHLARGGNWGNDAVALRSSTRNMSYANYPYFFCGFRSARTAQ